MKVIIAMFILSMELLAANMGIILSNSNRYEFPNDIASTIESEMIFQNQYYDKSNKISVISDKDGLISHDYKRKGKLFLIEMAKKRNLNSIALVEYKKSLKRFIILVVVQDKEVRDSKSTAVVYTQNMQQISSDIILANVLNLNYQLGVFNAKNVY